MTACEAKTPSFRDLKGHGGESVGFNTCDKSGELESLQVGWQDVGDF